MTVGTVAPALVSRRAVLEGAAACGIAAVFADPARSAAFAGAPAIQALIGEKIASRQLPGALVWQGIGRAPAKFVKGGTLDFDSATKVDEDSLWRLASMTKPIVGMATMLMVGEGRLKLDQPVADFIPAFADMRYLPDIASGVTRPVSRPITIRHLITHTNGTASVPTGKIAESYGRLNVRGTAAADAMAAPKDLAEWVARIATAPLAADPGTKWIYSLGLDVMGRVIEIISGVPFDVFLERRIFMPLGMRSTGFWVAKRDLARLVTMYTKQNGTLIASDRGPTSSLLRKPAIPRGSGGLVSSARDYDRFMTMVINHGTLDGTAVIPADAVRLGTSNLLPPGTDMSEYTSRTGHDGFGAAGMVTTGGRLAGTYGWGGSSGTTGLMNPLLGTRFGTFTNVGASDFGRRAMAAAGMTFGAAPTPGGSEVPLAPTRS